MRARTWASGVAILIVCLHWNSASNLAHAEVVGADALIQAVSPSASAPAAGQSVTPSSSAPGSSQGLREFKLSDPFLAQLFSVWRIQAGLSYELQSWVQQILSGETERAAHLWSVISPKLPESFEQAGAAAYLYTLWKLELAQTFMDEWVARLSNPKFAENSVAIALTQTIAPELDRWLLRHSVQFGGPESEAVLAKIAGSAHAAAYPALKAWNSIRKGEAAREALDLIPASSPLKLPLAQTVVIALAKRGDLAGAGRVLKTHLEPSIEARADARALARHYIQIARLLYQAGALEGAEQYYEKVPRGTPDYLSAHEELAWIRLRKGDQIKLRGELETLGSDLFRDEYAPEVPLVRAISNLKLCYYGEVERDFNRFLSRNRAWASRITAALEAQDPPPPRNPDRFSEQAGLALESRRAESAKLAALAQASITASLPAVGPQLHWSQAQGRMSARVQEASKRLAEEYRRQWRNDRHQLTEAIRKMQFVKVELLSQLRNASIQAAQAPANTPSVISDSIRVGMSAPALEANRDELIFKFDGVIWPDELFRLKSVAEGRCVSAAGSAQ